MKKTFVVSLCVLASACGGMNTDEMPVSAGGALGAVVGGFAGGYLGSELGGGLGNLIFTGVGLAAGASYGYTIGEILLPSDQTAFNNSALQSLNEGKDGEISNWSNPETGNSGIFTATQTYHSTTGNLCRDYRATLSLSKGLAKREGTACQQADGSWRSIEENFG